MITDLPSLLGPLAEDAFKTAFLRKARLHVASDDPKRAESLLPRWVLDRLIASEYLPARRLSVLRDGDVVPAAAYRGEDGRVRRAALDALVADGVSYVITGIDEDVPALHALVSALEERLAHDVWANAYVTHGEGGALPPHYDDHDVLALQIHGKKRWFSHGTPTPSPIVRSPDETDFGAPIWDALLLPSDVLYVPRGEVHHAEVEGNLSVHLAFGIDTRRGVDFVAEIAACAARDPMFREDLTRLGGEASLREKERALKTRLHALIDEASVTTFLDADDTERRTRRAAKLGARKP